MYSTLEYCHVPMKSDHITPGRKRHGRETHERFTAQDCAYAPWRGRNHRNEGFCIMWLVGAAEATRAACAHALHRAAAAAQQQHAQQDPGVLGRARVHRAGVYRDSRQSE